MFKTLITAAIATSLFAAPLLAQNHVVCSAISDLAESTAENRDNGASLDMLINIINGNKLLAAAERQHFRQLVTGAYNLQLPPDITARIAYDVCMGA